MTQAMNHAHITPLLYLCMPLMSICGKMGHSRAIVPILLHWRMYPLASAPFCDNFRNTMLCFANSGVATHPIMVVLAHWQSEPLEHFWETGGLATGPTPLTATRAGMQWSRRVAGYPTHGTQNILILNRVILLQHPDNIHGSSVAEQTFP